MAEVQIRAAIADDLHRRAKAAAALAGQQLKEYIAQAIADRVAADEAKREQERKEARDDNPQS